MAESSGQNSPLSNQENLNPGSQRQAARVLAQQQKNSNGEKLEAAGKAIEAGGKGAQAAGKGMQVAGKGMTSAGEGLSGTGAGAVIGVPLMAAGALTAGAGKATQAAGKGAEAAGQSAQKAGQGIQKADKSKPKAISRILDKIKKNGSSKSKPESSAQSAVKQIVGFSYTIWLAAFILAGIYDLYNIVSADTLSWADWIMDIFFGGGLTILLWSQGAKKNQTKKILQSALATLAKMIPVLDMLPFYSLLVLLLFFQAKKAHEEEENQN